MILVAAIIAIAARLNKASAFSTWLLSTSSPLALAGAEKLLDMPAFAIPSNELQRLCHRGRLVSGQKPPMDWFFDSDIDLLHFNQSQPQLRRGRRVAASTGALDRHLAKSQFHLG